MRKVIGVILGLALAGCGGEDLNTLEDMIIGGTPTTGDPAIVALFAAKPGATSGALCTAAVITPTRLLTAAHCVDPALVGADAVYQVFMGPDINDPNKRCPCVAVTATHKHPSFSANNPAAGNDVGIVDLAQAVTVTPLPWNRNAITNSMVNQPVRLVGYGLNNAFKQAGAGVKRTVTVSLASFTSKLIRTGLQGKGMCSGDSGGPDLMTINGRETIVGINSFGYAYCLGKSSSTRVDAFQTFINQYIQ